MLWYVLARYVEVTLGKSHICGQEPTKYVRRKVDRDENKENEGESGASTSRDEPDRPYLTAMEYHGLRSIVVYLSHTPGWFFLQDSETEVDAFNHVRHFLNAVKNFLRQRMGFIQMFAIYLKVICI